MSALCNGGLVSPIPPGYWVTQKKNKKKKIILELPIYSWNVMYIKTETKNYILPSWGNLLFDTN